MIQDIVSLLDHRLPLVDLTAYRKVHFMWNLYRLTLTAGEPSEAYDSTSNFQWQTPDVSFVINVDSKTEGKITVKPGVDMHLDELREQYANIPALLDRVAAEIMKEPAFRSTSRQVVQAIVQFSHQRKQTSKTNTTAVADHRAYVVYFPQIGYLIQVPGGEIVDMLTDPSLEQQFASATE